MYVVRPNMRRWLWERVRYKWQKPPRSGDSAGVPQGRPVKKDDHMLDSSRFVFQLRPDASRVRSRVDKRSLELRCRERVQEQLMERERERGNMTFDVSETEMDL